jgi:Tetratricopeptide repeat
MQGPCMAAPNSFWFSYRLIITTNVTRCGRTEARPSNKLPPSVYIPLKWNTLTYRNQGRWKEAEELEVQVMETSLRVVGQEHPDTLTSMNNLAWTWKGQNRDIEALDLISSCLELLIRKLGANHPNTTACTQTYNTWKMD